jgi:hypothetical protein
VLLLFVFIQSPASINSYPTLVTSQSFGRRIISSARSYLLDQELGSNLISFEYNAHDCELLDLAGRYEAVLGKRIIASG